MAPFIMVKPCMQSESQPAHSAACNLHISCLFGTETSLVTSLSLSANPMDTLSEATLFTAVFKLTIKAVRATVPLYDARGPQSWLERGQCRPVIACHHLYTLQLGCPEKKQRQQPTRRCSESALTSMISPLERVVKTKPIWYLPDITREEAVKLLANKKTGVRK